MIGSPEMKLREYFEKANLPAIATWADEVTLINPPFEHQVGDLNHLAAHTRCGLFNDAGLGKTRPLQAYSLWLVGQGNKVVTVMPPTLVIQYRESFTRTFQGVDDQVSISTLRGTVPQRNKLIQAWEETSWPDVLIMSNEMFVQYHEELLPRGYTCVIVDEAQSIKNAGTRIHKAVKHFGGDMDNSNGIVLSTGTPLETNPTDAYGFFAICYPQRYGSYRGFLQLHAVYDSGIYSGGRAVVPPQIIGYINLDYMHNGLVKFSRRIKKEDVLDLPPRLITEVKVDLSPRHKELYRNLMETRLAELEDRMLDLTEQTALYQAMQRSLICPEDYTNDKFTNTILESIDTILDTLEGQKVVIYCWYNNSIEKIKARYPKLNPATLYGKTTNKEAEKQKFLNDPTCRLMIANPKSGGVGVDGMQDVSSHMIFAEVCPFVGVVQQAIARLHRTGQKGPSVNVYILVPNGTIAVKLRNDLLRKDDWQEQVMKDKRTILRDLMGEQGIQGSLDDLQN